jgi:hypothetical protein
MKVKDFITSEERHKLWEEERICDICELDDRVRLKFSNEGDESCYPEFRCPICGEVLEMHDHYGCGSHPIIPSLVFNEEATVLYSPVYTCKKCNAKQKESNADAFNDELIFAMRPIKIHENGNHDVLLHDEDHGIKSFDIQKITKIYIQRYIAKLVEENADVALKDVIKNIKLFSDEVFDEVIKLIKEKGYEI